jgi:hypothetical protein
MRAAKTLRIGVILCFVLVLTTSVISTADALSKVSVATCRGADLIGSLTGSESGLGNGTYTFAVMNVGKGECRLEGFPSLEGYRGQHFYSLPVSHGYKLDTKFRPSILKPRMSGAFVLDATTGCMADGDPHQAEHTYIELALILPDNRGSVTIPSLTLYVPCQLSESALGWANGFTFVTPFPYQAKRTLTWGRPQAVTVTVSASTFPASVYPFPRSAALGVSRVGCPALAGLIRASTAPTRSTGAKLIDDLGGPRSVALEASDPTMWPNIVLHEVGATGRVSTSRLLIKREAASGLRDTTERCGVITSRDTWVVEACPVLSGSSGTASCQKDPALVGNYFLVNRRGHWLISFVYP